MTDTEFYTSIGMSTLAFYVLPIVLFFYLKHLYKKYKKPKETASQDELAAYKRIQALQQISKD